VVGTERHESRRIDNQLRGRTGRCVRILSGMHLDTPKFMIQHTQSRLSMTPRTLDTY